MERLDNHQQIQRLLVRIPVCAFVLLQKDSSDFRKLFIPLAFKCRIMTVRFFNRVEGDLVDRDGSSVVDTSC